MLLQATAVSSYLNGYINRIMFLPILVMKEDQKKKVIWILMLHKSFSLTNFEQIILLKLLQEVNARTIFLKQIKFHGYKHQSFVEHFMDSVVSLMLLV